MEKNVKTPIFKILPWCLSYCNFNLTWRVQFGYSNWYATCTLLKEGLINYILHHLFFITGLPNLTSGVMECSFWCNFYSDFDWRFNFVNITGIFRKGLKPVIILTVLEPSVIPVWRYFCNFINLPKDDEYCKKCVIFLCLHFCFFYTCFHNCVVWFYQRVVTNFMWFY